MECSDCVPMQLCHVTVSSCLCSLPGALTFSPCPERAGLSWDIGYFVGMAVSHQYESCLKT